MKPTAVKLVAVNDPQKGIPRAGKRRREAIKENRIQTVEMDRSMSSQEVENVILRAFKRIPIKAYTILDANQQGHLTTAECQEPTGEEIVDRVVKRKTSIYITKVVDKDSEVGSTSTSLVLVL